MATPNPAGLAAARQLAAWDIGDPTWADLIIDAYLKADDSDTHTCPTGGKR